MCFLWLKIGAFFDSKGHPVLVYRMSIGWRHIMRPKGDHSWIIAFMISFLACPYSLFARKLPFVWPTAVSVLCLFVGRPVLLPVWLQDCVFSCWLYLPWRGPNGRKCLAIKELNCDKEKESCGLFSPNYCVNNMTQVIRSVTTTAIY